MSEDKVILTPDEAISLLHDGEYIHNYANPRGGMFIGCDYDRKDAIEAIRAAYQIEIGGPECKRMRHPLAVWSSENRVTFFEADMGKVDAFEVAKPTT